MDQPPLTPTTFPFGSAPLQATHVAATGAPAYRVETPKLLNQKADSCTPPPACESDNLATLVRGMFGADVPIDGPPPNPPGRTGIDGTDGRWRAPKADEYIDERNIIYPRSLWQPPAPKRQRRKLAALDTPADVRRELGRLYADYHYRRIGDRECVRGVYALNSLLAALRQSAAADLAGQAAGQTAGQPPQGR